MSDSSMPSRREFIKTLTILAGTSALFTTIPWLQACGDKFKSAPLKDKVKLAVIGPGSRGSLLLGFLVENPNVEIVALCDDYKPNLDKAMKLVGGKVKGFSDYRRMLEMKEIQGIVIATPLHLHAQMTIDALRAGKHVFCEKAMAMTNEDCLAMYNTHKETGKILQIGHQRLFNLNYLKGIEMIKAGHFGKITQIRAYWHRNNNWRRPVPSPELERRINWRLYSEYSLGLMTELASHQLHVANWVLNEIPESVMGTGNIIYWKDGREVYDNVAVIYNYPSGVKLIWDSVISNKHYGLEEQVQGSKGTIEFEAGKYYYEQLPKPPAIKQLINDIENSVYDAIPIGGPSWVPETAIEDKGEYLIGKRLAHDTDTCLEMEAFAEAVRLNKITPGMAEAGYNSSIATVLGHQALVNNSIVKWPKEFML
jgi:predicted dehydrogenase